MTNNKSLPAKAGEIKEAIEILTDFLGPDDEWRQETVQVKRMCWAVDMGISALMRAMEPNERLTLEELRGMDGEPVYIVRGRGDDGWAVIGVENGTLYFHGPNFDDSPDEDFYDLKCANTTCSQPCKNGLHQFGWLAYCRKKEE